MLRPADGGHRAEARVTRWTLQQPSMTALLATLLVCSQANPSSVGDGASVRWVGSWSAATEAPLDAPASFDKVTLRQIVRATLGGNVVRVRLSNAHGTDPLHIAAASIGLRSSGASAKPATLRALHFAGADFISIPSGGVALSDPVSFDVHAGDDLAISLFVATPQSGVTQLTLSHQTSYVSRPGNFTNSETMPVASTIASWYWLSGVEVASGSNARAVVTFGDSITEGFNSTTDANARWPDVLSRRFQAGHRPVAVLNEGISGNRVLNDVIGPNAAKRIDRDVLTQAGVGFVVLLLGTNDLRFSQFSASSFGPGVSLANVSAEDIIVSFEQIIRRVHQAGAKIYGATILPFNGDRYYDAGVETKRAAINQFIRTSHRFDGVIDFDVVMRDPAQPTRLLTKFDSGDHLHPNDAGYAAMGNCIDLTLFDD